MIRHFFLDKTNSIIAGSRCNVGLNPILKLNYGKDLSRGLIHFDESPIQHLIDEKEITLDNTKFTLKMVNCFSVDGVPYEKKLTSSGNFIGKRACSFDLILFRLPQDFDEGRGFDFTSDFWLKGNKSHSEDGSSWFFSKNGMVWERDRKKKLYFKKINKGDDLNPSYEYTPIDYSVIDAVFTEEIPANKDITPDEAEYIYIEKNIDFTKGDINWDTIIRDKDLKGGIYSQEYLLNEYNKYHTYYRLTEKRTYYSLVIDGWNKSYVKSENKLDGAIFMGDYVYGRIENLPMGQKAPVMPHLPSEPSSDDPQYIKLDKGGCPVKYEFYKLMTRDEYMENPPMNAYESIYTNHWEYVQIDFPTDDEKCKAVEIKTIHIPLSQDSDEIVKESSIIITEQHFDFGQENLSMDITDYVKDIISKQARNFGLGLAFAPSFEMTEMNESQYVGFFTDHTNTFFHPYVEMISDNIINDDRNAFCLGQTNRLYLYANVDGEPVNLDNLPVCEINDVPVKVGQSKKGVYFAEITPDFVELEPHSIGYDKWSEISLNGAKIDDVEMEFEVMPINRKIQIGSLTDDSKNIIPFIEGINDGEKLSRGEIRTISVHFRKKYSIDEKHLAFNAEYRLYVKDGKENREYDVIDYTPIERGFLNNFFMIYTEDLIPNKYHIDIRLHDGRNVKYFKDISNFEIVSDVTERYE